MINLHIVEGRLTKNPDYRVDEKNNQVFANTTIACTRNYKSRAGTYESDFITISLRGNEATNFSKLCMKGDLISIVGRTQTDVVQGSDGKKQYYTKTHVMNWSLLSKAKNEGEQTSLNAHPSAIFAGYDPNRDFTAAIEQMTLPEEDRDIF
ncbi:single-stranded DNA-binding protein [Lactococcus allomyrinae]|uniref:Single-stranded DNA-binding protein n=1 Tax=Lactococcus allomyrinae TaxID=2419773 RepID=A0A387BDT8_9LACT|nr:single-stranded DNA-binding protein [Lactococcus allomyrinae]AYG02033.1 single-stranded DNA-binding protein [Lactococcus allomyrinae]